jgi:hypothetical protein
MCRERVHAAIKAARDDVGFLGVGARARARARALALEHAAAGRAHHEGRHCELAQLRAVARRRGQRRRGLGE